ncbi:hypothetical protein niasHT_035946 [Heterodera trifolii]|uniref:Uncharacterized protein n=1 Tax=Heterodera trifolii TaxID=157864 RepID=A0ABD2J892_9BILA
MARSAPTATFASIQSVNETDEKNGKRRNVQKRGEERTPPVRGTLRLITANHPPIDRKWQKGRAGERAQQTLPNKERGWDDEGQ